jgi:MoaA/NifB/PqqE/SkfB family radical SAM enzyme
MSIRVKAHLVRLFVRLVGRVPAGHLWYLGRRLRREKPHVFAGQLRINSFFPPFPGAAFDRFVAAAAARRRVPYSAYVAVTDECPYRCPHCSYARRRPGRPTREELLAAIGQLKALGTATLGLTGGEPLLRDDLEDLLAAAGPEMATILFTSGHGLDAARAARLADAAVGNVTVGLDSADPAEHDRVRGRAGSFEEARAAVAACREAGLYTALSTVAMRHRVASGGLEAMYRLAEAWGVQELRLLPPVATGGWLGRTAQMLTPDDRSALARFHAEHNRRRDGPAVAAVPYLESAEMFGCGAGYHHLFIDAAGEVCPCDLAPLSFGNVRTEPLAAIWDRMAAHFPRPRCSCLMAAVADRIAADTLPLPRAESEALCRAPAQDAPLPEVYRRLMRR